MPSKLSIGLTAAVMAAQWLLFLILNQRWLSVSGDDCGPDSPPECGMFDFIPQLTFGSGSVLAVLGLALAIGVALNRTPALVTGAILHLVALCHLGPAISQAPISDTAQTVWGWVFALTNLALTCTLFSLAAAPRMPETPS